MVTQDAEQRNTGGMIRNETQADTGDLTAINNPPVDSERNADLELNKTSFRGTKENRIEASNAHRLQGVPGPGPCHGG